ncbi:MAG: sulfotransferase family protein [Prochlorotrichaceae cyanobacterium]
MSHCEPLQSDKFNAGLSASHLFAEAIAQVPNASFSSPETLETALSILVQSLNTEAALHEVGHRYFHDFLLRLLTNHLKLQQGYDRYPEIKNVPLFRPLIVVGLFRSGTTFLHNLLSQDPQSRWLSVAEALYPTPAPRLETWSPDPRILQAIKHIQFQDSLTENFSAAHHIDAVRPAECSRLFEHDLIGHLFDFRANVPSYSHWLLEQDLTEAYRSYRQQLQYLSWQWSGSHWVLKAPAHLLALDTLLQVFPDAAIVYLHRDPVKVLPSCCSLSAIGRSRFSSEVNELALGEHWLNLLAEGVNRGMSVRDQWALGNSNLNPNLNKTPIYEVSYSTLIQDPLGMIQKIYHYFNYDFSPEMKVQLQQWIQDNPQHKHGVHRYTLDQFGLSEPQIQEKFSLYYDRFGSFL